MSTRTMSVAGSFYPEHRSDVCDMIDQFNTVFDAHPDAFAPFNQVVAQALIVPHAGWIYSGFTANIAFRILTDSKLSTIVVIGPSHRVGFEGISIADATRYETPLGELAIDTDLLNELKKNFALPHYPQAHHEHSTEVQMPFIKYYMPEVRVVELVYGYTSPSALEPIIEYCIRQKDTGVVISTDLSHYHPLAQAERLDSICLKAIEDENIPLLHEGCEACGIIGVEAMLAIAKKHRFKSTVLDYRTSADASGDTSRVVGYASVLFS